MPIDQFGRPLPYTDTREVYSVPPAGGVPVRPRATGVPPRAAIDPNDLLATAAAEQDAAQAAMRPDAGIGNAPPRDPYMAGLPPRAPTSAPVTALTPGRTTPFSRADAQALAALDPRALDEAKALAAMPESTPAKITGSFGGRNFEMQPAARVDRNALARLYAQAQERKGQERQDAVRGQEQAGRERIVAIPGEQLGKRREMELGAEERMAGKKFEAEAPVRQAEIEAKRAQTAATTGAEQRAAAQAAREPSPEQKAIDEALAQAEASPFAQTPEGRKRIEALRARSTAGRSLPPEAIAQPGPDIGTVTAEIMADPGMAAIIARAKETEPGFFTGSRGRDTGAAARQLAERAIRARLSRAGASPEDIQAAITSILGATAAPTVSTPGGAVTRATQVAGGGSLPIGLIGAFSR